MQSRIDVGSSPLSTTIVANEEHGILSAPGVLQALVHGLALKQGDAMFLARRTRIAEVRLYSCHYPTPFLIHSLLP